MFEIPLRGGANSPSLLADERARPGDASLSSAMASRGGVVLTLLRRRAQEGKTLSLFGPTARTATLALSNARALVSVRGGGVS